MSQITPATLNDPAFLQLPALTPPPGVIPNFANPRNRGTVLIIVNGVLLALMITFIAFRAYTKLAIVRKVSWDDLTVSLSALGAITLYVLFIWQIQRAGLGKHQWDIRMSELLGNDAIISSYLVEVISTPTLWITKFTFFLLYMQIFWPMRWLRISIYTGATLSTAFYVGITIVMFDLATPRPGQSWRDGYLSEREQRTNSLSIPIASMGLVIDVLLLILPSVAVYKLQLHVNRKIGLMLIFSTGFVAVVASAMSIYFRYVNYYFQDVDVTWNLLNLQLMTLVEVQVGVITASMPSFARMLHHHLPPWKQFKSYFSFPKVPSHTKSSKWSRSTLVEGSVAAKSGVKEKKMPHNSATPFADTERSMAEEHGTDSAPYFEMDKLKSVKTYINGGQRGNVDEDGIYLKHDLEHTWSPMDSANALSHAEH